MIQYGLPLRDQEKWPLMTALSLKSHTHLALQSVIHNSPSKWFGGQETKQRVPLLSNGKNKWDQACVKPFNISSKHIEVLHTCRCHNPECTSLRLGLKMLLLVPSCLHMEETLVRFGVEEMLLRVGSQSVPDACRWQGVGGLAWEDLNTETLSVRLSCRTSRDEAKWSGFQAPCDGDLTFIWFVSLLRDVQHGNMS